MTPHTHRMARFSVDAAALDADIAAAGSLAYNDSYGDFICGTLRSAMLWNRTGKLGETLLADYTGAAQRTPNGDALPYVSELICRLFDTERLRYARLLCLAPGSVLVPHRDYLELSRNFYRIHVPLRTDEKCFSSEEDVVYQMRRGEIWFLDATKAHSAASFSTTDRIHLVVDLIADDLYSVLKFNPDPGQSIPESNTVRRRPPRSTEHSAFQALSGIISTENYKDILAIIIKMHFLVDLSANDVFALMKKIAADSRQADVLDKAVWHEEYCLVRR
jgi:L-proline cis-4-hydroxylase